LRRWRGSHAERNERSGSARKGMLVVDVELRLGLGLSVVILRGHVLELRLRFSVMLRLRLESVRLGIEVWHRLERLVSVISELRSTWGVERSSRV
jgi:hypothetical protein